MEPKVRHKTRVIGSDRTARETTAARTPRLGPPPRPYTNAQRHRHQAQRGLNCFPLLAFLPASTARPTPPALRPSLAAASRASSDAQSSGRLSQCPRDPSAPSPRLPALSAQTLTLGLRAGDYSRYVSSSVTRLIRLSSAPQGRLRRCWVVWAMVIRGWSVPTD